MNAGQTREESHKPGVGFKQAAGMVSRAFRIGLEMYYLLDMTPSKLHNYFELKYHHVREALLDYLNRNSASLFFITISPLVFFMAQSHFETEFLFDFYHVSFPVDCKFQKCRV